jgi:N-acyl homoserine lactone hydrolase
MTVPTIDIVPLEMGTFTFADDEPDAGQQGVVMAYLVRHAGGLLLFDTGMGFGSQLFDDRYHPRARRLEDVLAAAGHTPADVGAVVNCHLHADHAGQNHRLPGVPIHAQPAEWTLVQAGNHTIDEWVDFPGADYRLRAGEYELFPGIRVIATPGHTAGHQSVAVETPAGLFVLAGQACYSRGEWSDEAGAREGRSRAPDQAAYDRSLARLRDLRPARVYFGHDRAAWSADR